MHVDVGKIFEAQIQKYVPDYAKVYRLPDSAQSFAKNSKLRFSHKNPFDYFIWDSIRHKLYCLELKSKSTNSISFERNQNEKRDIHFHQIEGLNEWNNYDGTICGFLIEFRSIEKTIFLHINDFNKLINIINKKSFSIKDLDKNKIEYIIVPQKKLKTRYFYDMNFLMNYYEEEKKK